MNNPKITVVTIVLNDENTINRTIESVKNQTYKNIEYIIIDGKSTDNTLSIINKHMNYINTFISEEDNGLYDAMNKGINLSSGDWLFFLNSGDVFYSIDTISNIVQAIDSTTDILYGDIITVDENMKNPNYLVANGIENIAIYPPFWHQGMLIKASIHKKKLYDLKYKSCSDYDFMMYCVTNNYNCKYINLPFTYYLRGGESTTNVYINRLEGVAISSKYLDIKLLDKNFYFRDLVDNHIKKPALLSELLLDLDIKLRDLEAFLNTLKQRYKRIALYGGGTIANLIAPLIGNNLKIIVDKNYTQINTNYPLCSPEDLKKHTFDCILITPIRYSSTVREYLINDLKIKSDKIIAFDYVAISPNSLINKLFPKIDSNKDFEAGICTQEKLESKTYKKWITYFKKNPKKLYRKNWEFAFIAESLYKREMLKKGKNGLGFAVGEEPLPSAFCSFGSKILATDLNFDEALEKGWVNTNQHAKNLEQLNNKKICNPEKFRKLCSFKNVDMNNIPKDLKNFDFIWSACALEHLGSIKQGEEFIYNSLDCVKPGGIAVHTTEYNFSSNEDTITSGPTVLFRKKDIERIVNKLQKMGHTVEKIDYNGGTLPIDKHVDFPPYFKKKHIKLLLDKYIVTSIGIIIKKKL